jgi:hypothetical protein
MVLCHVTNIPPLILLRALLLFLVLALEKCSPVLELSDKFSTESGYLVIAWPSAPFATSYKPEVNKLR